MLKIDIVIPTCKNLKEIESQRLEIQKNTSEENYLGIWISGFLISASKNRNEVHKACKGDIIVSLDDDIQGFYPGWLTKIVTPLIEDENIRFASARLMNKDGSIGFMMTSKKDLSQDYEIVSRCPTSAFAYRRKDFEELKGFWNEFSLPFDENFIGSGWEDDAICHDLVKRFPETKIIINNKVKLIHLNEQKNQKENLAINKEYFYKSGRNK